MPCPVCGYANPEGTARCAACGTQLVAEPQPVARPGDAVCATHPEQPALQPCARCGTFYCAACLERATDGQLYCVQCRSRSTLPWDQRDQLGLMRAYWQTCKVLLLEPTRTLSNTPRDGTLASSLVFALVASVVGYLPTLAVTMVAFEGAFLFAAGQKADELRSVGVGLAVGAFFFAFYLVLYVGIQIVFMFCMAAVQHLVLHLTGERQLGGYTVTLRAHALGMAPFLLGLLPGCGFVVMALWSLVLQCLTIHHLHRVTAGKAVAAVLGPWLLLCGCGGLAYFALVAAAVSAAGLSR